MAAVEITEETKQQVERIGSADVVVGIAGTVAADELRARAEQHHPGTGFRSFARCGSSSRGLGSRLKRRQMAAEAPALTLLPFSPPAQASEEFWAGSFGQPARRAGSGRIAECAGLHCARFGSGGSSDSGYPALHLRRSRSPVRPGDARLSRGKVRRPHQQRNSFAVEPGALWQARSLSARRSISPPPALCADVWRAPASHADGSGNSLLWPVTVAATQSPQAPVGQVHVDVRHQVADRGPGTQRGARAADRLAVSGNGPVRVALAADSRIAGDARVGQRRRRRARMGSLSTRSPCSIRSCWARRTSMRFGDWCCRPTRCSNCAA